MVKEKLLVIQESDITNNCPECFNQEMKIIFYQKHTYGKFYHKTTKEVSHKIECQKCNSIIYPVNWTDDIEKIFDYYKKMVKPEKASIRFTTLFYVMVLLLIILVGAGVYLYLEGGIPV